MPASPLARDSYHNIVNLRVPTFAEGPGFTRIAKAPIGRSWFIESVWMHNWHATKNYRVTCSRKPYDWPLDLNVPNVSNENLYLFRDLKLTPGQMLTVPITFVLAHGDELWGFQLEADTGDATYGITMVVAAKEGVR